MEAHIAEVEFIRDGLLDRLNDPTLPFLDRQLVDEWIIQEYRVGVVPFLGGQHLDIVTQLLQWS